MPLYAGVSETNITPPHGVWMCGYAFRPTGCVAVHDELYARALVLNDGNKALAILSMDLIGLDFDLVRAVRQGISEKIGVSEAAILLNATHTHGGPNVRDFNAMGSRDPAYIDVLTRKLIGVCVQAADQMRPASLGYANVPVQVGVNRRQYPREGQPTCIGRNFGGPVDADLDALVVSESRGEPFALLLSHACHPTTVGGDNLQITADYPGVACEVVRQQTGGRIMPFFLQGCCGNINPEPRGTWGCVERHGQAIGAAALDALNSAEPLSGRGLAFDGRTVMLPLLPPPSMAECDRNLAECEAHLESERAGGHVGKILHAEGLRDYARLEREIAGQRNPQLEKPFDIQRLRIGDLQVLGMPAEMFVQYALDFEQQASGLVMALAYTNGVHGYVPIAADYPFGGYEVAGAYRYYGTLMYTPECERIIREAAYRLLGVEEPDRTPYSVEA